MKIISVVTLFAIFLACPYASAEYNIATGKQDLILVSTEKEVAMGDAIAKKIEEKFGLAENKEMQERVERVGQKLVEVCDRKELIYHFKVLDDDEVNAVSLPGGWVYVNKGLIEEVKSDDELAGVIAHEIGHIAARHSVQKLQTGLTSTLLMILAAGANTDREFKRGANLALVSLMTAYSREDEFEADRRAVKYTTAAGYDPNAIVTFLETLRQVHRNKPLRPKSFFRAHPYVAERIGVVKQEITGSIDFEGWINRPVQ